MEIQVNGVNKVVPEGITIAQLLEVAGVADERVAVEYNGIVVDRGHFFELVVEAGAVIEIVRFVGGG